MPNFETPEPISVDLDLVVGDARVVASDRAVTVVDVHPSDAGSDQDRRAAEQTRVEYVAGRLVVKAPRQRGLGLFTKVGSVDVTIEVPTGSDLQAKAAVAAFRCQGRLGRCQVKTATGDVQFDETGALDVDTGIGVVEVAKVAGDAEIHTGSGRVRIGEVDGTTVIKNSNGQCWVGLANGELRASSANGDVAVGKANAGVTASTANGDVRVGQITRGSASLKTALGAVEIGIRNGTAAQLDVYTSFGRVLNQLNSVDGPGSTDETVQVHARTSYGDIVIRRS